MNLIKDLGIIKGRRRGIYECSQCKKHIERRTSHVKTSLTSLCQACLMSNKFKIHGKTNTRLFRIWQGMKDRCYNPNNPNYKYYGAKHIYVINTWKNNFETFYSWALLNGYDDTKVIDKDILCEQKGFLQKRYSPETCLWITTEENTFQANKNRIKEVYQYDLENNFIAKYISQSEASRQTKLSQGNIGMVLRGKRKQTGGFLWKHS